MKERRRKTGTDPMVAAGVAGVAGDGVGRFGSGIKEHIVSYGGVDNETGQVLKRSLKEISEYGVNPEFRDQNLKQQAGFSAEVKEVARRRAEEAIAGKKPTTVRTDDIPGHVNNQLFDITAKVDANGNPVPGSSLQMKFVGATPKKAVSAMLGRDYRKYIDNDCRILVPRDYFERMKADLSERIERLEKQIASLKEDGNVKAAAQKQKLLDTCQKLRNKLEKSTVSNAEALEAKTNPKWSTAKDVIRVAHRAGVEQAKMGAAIGGGVSVIRNAVAYFSGKKDGKAAVLGVAKDTAGAAALSYGTGVAGSVIKGVAQNSASSAVRAFSKTNLPAFMATAVFESGKTLTKYFKGDIDGAQCLEELGEKGYGMVNSAMFAAIGQVAIPIPVVGALAGGMIGYALSSASYKILTDSLKTAKLAQARRVAIEKQCQEAINMLRVYRQQLEDGLNTYLRETRAFFDATFLEIKRALQIGDADGYIAAANRITIAFGGSALFAGMAEFEALMASDAPIIF